MLFGELSNKFLDLRRSPARRKILSAGSDIAGHGVKGKGIAAEFDVMEKFRVLTESA
jgi:hypothetical protein